MMYRKTSTFLFTIILLGNYSMGMTLTSAVDYELCVNEGDRIIWSVYSNDGVLEDLIENTERFKDYTLEDFIDTGNELKWVISSITDQSNDGTGSWNLKYERYEGENLKWNEKGYIGTEEFLVQ